MKKEPFTDKVIKRFYGISGPLDEYKKSEINRIGNLAFILLSALLLIGNFLSFLLATFIKDFPSVAYPIFLSIALLFLFSFVMIQVRKSQVDIYDSEEAEYSPKQVRNNLMQATLVFTLTIHALDALFSFTELKTSYLIAFVSPKLLIRSLIGGIIWGGLMYIFLIKKTRK